MRWEGCFEEFMGAETVLSWSKDVKHMNDNITIQTYWAYIPSHDTLPLQVKSIIQRSKSHIISSRIDSHHEHLYTLHHNTSLHISYTNNSLCSHTRNIILFSAVDARAEWQLLGRRESLTGERKGSVWFFFSWKKSGIRKMWWRRRMERTRTDSERRVSKVLRYISNCRTAVLCFFRFFPMSYQITRQNPILST